MGLVDTMNRTGVARQGGIQSPQPLPRPAMPLPQTEQQYDAPVLPADPTRDAIAANQRQFYGTAPFSSMPAPTEGNIRGPNGQLLPVQNGGWGDTQRMIQKYGTADVRNAYPPTVRVHGVDFRRDDFTYGGVNQGQWNQSADQALGRRGPTTNYADAMQARNMQLTGLGQMQQSRGMWEQAAMGNGPSAAQAQFQGGLDQSIAAQMAMANSARGGAGALASARQGAALQGGQMQANAVSQAAQLRANEMNQARMGLSQADQMYGGQLSQLAQQDTQRAQYGTQAALQQRQMNDQLAMGMYGLGHQASLADLGGRQAFATAQGQADFSTQQANANLDLGHQAADMQALTNIAGATLGAAGGAAGWAMGAGKR